MINFYRKIVTLAVLVLISTAFIFSNSLKNKEESKEDSDVIVKVVEDVAEKIYPENQLDWNYIVRKSAHLFEFFVLGSFTMLFTLSFGQKCRKPILYAFIYVILIACTDETIQYFTERGACFTDVMIDISGAAIGIGALLILNVLKNRYFAKKTKTGGMGEENHDSIRSV